MPRQRPRKIPAPKPRQGKTSDGSAKDYLRARLHTLPEVVEDGGAPVRRKALSRTAENLLAELFRRYAFSMACRNGVPVEWAGDKLLGVGKARAYEIKREQEEFDDNSWEWFEDAVMRAIQQGKIARGRDTAKSPMADAFFAALAGGTRRLRWIRVKFGRQTTCRLEEVNKGQKDWEVEVNDYLVHSHLLWRLMQKEDT